MERFNDGSSCGRHREKSGRWLDLGFPTTGWRFNRLDEYGEEGRLCDMCQCSKVRVGHLLTNDLVPNALTVGLHCAELLEQNFYLPQKRERAYRDDLRIQHDWPKRVWKVSRQGNHYVNARGFNITVWDKGGGGFGLTIRLENKFDGRFELNGKRLFKTVDEAKEAGLAALLYARRKFRSAADLG